MDQQEHENEFFNLINDVYINLFKYLDGLDIKKMRLSSRKMNRLVDTYIRRHRQTFLRFPPRIYNIENIEENIVNACRSFFGKQPNECDMTLNCKIFYKEEKTLVTTNPPMKALSAVSKSGIKISLNIMFDFRYDDRSVNLWPSYISTLEEIVKYLPHTEYLHLDFSSEIMEEWGNDVINILSQMTQLKSLSICKMHVDGTELTSCLSKMTDLSSFSISEIKIDNLDSIQLGHALQIVVPRLSKLKLSSSFVGFQSIIEVLPLIRNLLSNLTSLDLSNNYIDRDKLQYNIVYDILGHVSNLRTLNLSHNEIGMYIEGVPHPINQLIQSLKNLEELNLAHNGIDGNCIHELSPTLQILPLLSNLDLSSNKLDYDAIKFVTEYLPMVKVLDVTDNNPNDEQGGMESLD